MRTTEFRRLLRTAATGAMAVCSLCILAKARACGFELREGSIDWMANAFAGDTAKAYDASTAWSNPAGRVRLDRCEINERGPVVRIQFRRLHPFGPTR